MLDKNILARVRGSMILDFRHLHTLREVKEAIEGEIELIPHFRKLIGCFCLSSVIMFRNPAHAISRLGKDLGVSFMFDLDLGSSCETMSHWGKVLRGSGFPLVTINCSHGKKPVWEFIVSITNGDVSNRGRNGKKKNRPLVVGVGIPDSMDSAEIITQFGVPKAKKYPYFLNILNRCVDGIACTVDTLPIVNSSQYRSIYRLCTDANEMTVRGAFLNGADLFLIKDRPDISDEKKASLREAFMLEFYKGINEKIQQIREKEKEEARAEEVLKQEIAEMEKRKKKKNSTSNQRDV